MEHTGLTSEEVNSRVRQGQCNKVESTVSRSYFDILIKNLCTPFNLILIILGISLFCLHEPINAVAASGVIVMNVMISTFQEMKAKHRLDKISLLLRPKTTVIRDGEERIIDPSGIVMGDIIVLRAGEQAQVDGKVLESYSFELDESPLTGESSTVRKNPGDTIYSGTFCVAGECIYEVNALGEDTFASKMLSTAKRFEKKNTPLQKETSFITELLMGISFLFLFIVVIKNLILGKVILDSMIDSVLILDIVPIGLFLLITITYMISAVRMSNTGVLLQNSGSVESMSHVDTVCMDKTGTITTNNLVFEEAVYYADKEYADRLIGDFLSVTGSRNHTVNCLVKAFPSDGATLIEEIQFTSARKYSAATFDSDGRHTVYMGAHNVLSKYFDTDVSVPINDHSKRGLRSVVICVSEDPIFANGEPTIGRLEILAVIAIRDEVRPDCKRILEDFADNGMEIKVISGDNPDSVDALFTLAGIPGERHKLSGDEMDLLGDDKEDIIADTNIFGRMRPEQKEEVINILRKKGHYVAMVGDGVNDVRSLKAANVGIALQSGSGAARGVADMVLVDDHFDALPKAISEGKRTVSGMRDILKLYLTRNFVLAILIAIVLVTIGMLPLLPIQNTYYALITVSLESFLIALWAKPSDNKELILPGVMRYCIPTAFFIGIFSIIIYFVFNEAVMAGMLSLDLSMNGVNWEIYSSMFSGSYEEFLSLLTGMKDPGSISLLECEALVMGRSAMLFFLVAVGLLQIYFVFPPFGFLSRDRKACPAKVFPTVMFLLAVLLMYAFYNVPWVSMGLASVPIMGPEAYSLAGAFIAVWFVISMVLNRSTRESRIATVTESIFRRLFYRDRLFKR